MIRLISKKIGLVFLGVFLALLILEIGLRIAGFVFLAPQHYENLIIPKAGNVYRILALGESTTANLQNGQSSWPEELEIILNMKSENVKFKVFNEGVPSTTTTKILNNLEENLEKYKPDMIITMIGANDLSLNLRYENLRMAKFGQVFEDLRTYKLFKFISQSLEHKFEEIENNTKKIDGGDNPKGNLSDSIPLTEMTEIKRFYEMNETKNGTNSVEDYEKEERMLKKAVEENPSDAKPLFKLGKIYEAHGNKKQMVEVIKKLVPLAPNSSQAYQSLGLMFLGYEMYNESEEMFKKAIQLNPRLDIAYAELGNLYSYLNKSKEAIDMYYRYIDIIKRADEHLFKKLIKLHLSINNSKDAYEIAKFVVYENPELAEEVHIVGKLYADLDKHEEAYSLFISTVDKNRDNFAAWTELVWYHLNNDLTNEKAEKIFNIVMKINPSHLAYIYENIGDRYKKNGMQKEADEMYNRATEITEKFKIVTHHNYRELYKILSEKGIKLVIMQYPNTDISELKGIFKQDEDIIFVSNEENFKRAIANSTYYQYFIDVGGYNKKFGHATKKGNQLIAKNVANIISKDLEIN